MRTIFYLKDNFILYWDNVVMAFSMLLFAAVLYTFFVSAKGKRRVLLAMVPCSIAFSFVCSRLLYWLCHQEQFAGVKGAFQNVLTPGYCLTGVLLGVLLAAIFVKVVQLEKKFGKLLDAAGVATAFTYGCLRLSALFNETCRGKIEITEVTRQRLPLAASITNAIGETEYRFASFMVEAILLGVVFVVLAILFSRQYLGRKAGKHAQMSGGKIYLLSLVFLASVELILDSTRYDSCFMPFNGFISIVQILSAVSALVAMIILFVKSVKRQQKHICSGIMLFLFVLSIAGVGITEYLIQRHGDWYKSCYLGMGVSCLLMDVTACVLAMRKGKLRKKEGK